MTESSVVSVSGIDLNCLYGDERAYLVRVMDSLDALDKNRDGFVNFDEAKGHALILPDSFDFIDIADEKDFDHYQKILISHHNTGKIIFNETLSFAGSAVQVDRPFGSPESWYHLKWKEIEERGHFSRYAEFWLLDFFAQEGVWHFLFRCDKEGDEDDSFFVLSVPEDLDQMEIQFSQTRHNLNDKPNHESLKDLIKNFLGKAFSLFTTNFTWLEKDRREKLADRLEALTLAMEENAQKPALKAMPDKSTLPRELAERLDMIENHRDRLFCRLIHYKTSSGQSYPIWLSFEKALGQDEIEKAKFFLKSLPEYLIKALSNKGLLSEKKKLELEIRENDLFNFKFDTAAAFHTAPGLVVFRKSVFKGLSQNFLRSIFIHELGHALFLVASREDWKKYYRQVKGRTDRKLNFFPSIYGSRDAIEFFAESVVAYVNGEEDPSPYSIPVYGRRDRRELREKTPELYLALRLYLEPDDGQNSFFADSSLFTLSALEALSRVAQERPDLLAPSASVDMLDVCYQVEKRE